VPTPRPGDDIALVPVASGFERPVDVVDAGDAAGRLYVVEQTGLIRVAENGVVRSPPFLDVRGRITHLGNEQGLLGLAFAPDYAQSGRFFVNYTNVDGDTVIERFHVAADGAADPGSGAVVLKIDQPASNHNGGNLVFGPDGMLWVGMGDGGGGASANGQRRDALLGKMLRIDVSGDTYTPAPGNPFLNDPDTRPEIWALGLRNPWRYSFDRQTGDLWIADVGAGRWEEIDVQPATSRGGENYGWPRMEGPDCNGGPCDPAGFVLPVTAYAHGNGDCAVVGGFVYRGSRFRSLAGMYLYGDSCSGRIWGVDAAAAANRTGERKLLMDTDAVIGSFGQDRDGELYVTDLFGGVVYQVAAP
jgi:glucose/arabinose dehydrogenase